MSAGELTSREILETAARVCTDKELRVLVLFEDGRSYRRIAAETGVALSTVRDTLERATRKLGRALASE